MRVYLEHLQVFFFGHPVKICSRTWSTSIKPINKRAKNKGKKTEKTKGKNNDISNKK